MPRLNVIPFCAALLLLVPRVVSGNPPALTPLQLLPGDATIGPAAGTQESPEIAPGPSGTSLIVWSDSRTALGLLVNFYGGPYFGAGLGSMRDIYAARLDVNGQPLDVIPIIVSQAMLNQGTPRVAWNGQNWLIVWKGQGGLACCPNVAIWASRVSPQGSVLDPAPILIDPGEPFDAEYPEVGSDGTNWVVVWQDRDGAGNATLDGTRVSPSGSVLDPGGVRLRQNTWNSYPTNPEIVWATDEYLLTWLESAGNLENTYDVRGLRLTSSLAPLDAAPFTINLMSITDARNPFVATNGTSFFVTWFEDRYYGWAQVFAARVSHAGQVLDPNGIEITPYSEYSQFDPAAAWDGTRWIVTYNRQPAGTFDDNIYASRVNSSGIVQDPAGVPVMLGPESQNAPALIPVEGGGARIVWMDTSAGGTTPEDIVSIRLFPGGATSAPTTVSRGAPRQSQASLAAGASGYLAVFRSEVSGTSRILGQRLDASGTAIDPEPFMIALGFPHVSQPEVAWNGAVYQVVWTDLTSTMVFGRRVGPDGTLLDASPVNLLPGDSPTVAALGDVFLVVSAYQVHHFKNLYSVRVRGDGVRLDSAPVFLGGDFARSPEVRALGDRWVIVWERYPTHDNPRSDLEAMLIAADGSPGPTFAVADNSIASEVNPALDVGPESALVLWSSGGDVHGRRLLADGTFAGSAFPVSVAANTQSYPSVAWNGTEYVAAWRDDRNMAATDQTRGDIFGARITDQGIVLDDPGFVVQADSLPQEEAVVAASGGETILAFSTFRPDSPYGAMRIGYRSMVPSVSGVSDGSVQAGELVRLLAPSPNPAGRTMLFRFELSQSSEVRLEIFDLGGRKVRTVLEERRAAGRHAVIWNTLADSGQPVARGMYLYRLEASGTTRTGKVMIAR